MPAVPYGVFWYLTPYCPYDNGQYQFGIADMADIDG